MTNVLRWRSLRSLLYERLRPKRSYAPRSLLSRRGTPKASYLPAISEELNIFSSGDDLESKQGITRVSAI
ncbi:hypothetical protein [Nodularia sp. NIES-3585]|uniref:hypothetical protein n=1 Tax=Nodularia sp. NIES-3585 TaxID=1973477 RepID=UPI0011318CA9|nr:hypothetical protein [Nodularia sp. NIES-3585]